MRHLKRTSHRCHTSSLFTKSRTTPRGRRFLTAHRDLRREAGERSYQVLKYQNDSNRIVHFSVWTSLDAAREFFESPQLIRIRAEAGVKSPDFIYLEQLEAATF